MLQTLDRNEFDMPNLLIADQMFYYNTQLTIRNTTFRFPKATTLTASFGAVKRFETSNFYISRSANCSGAFSGNGGPGEEILIYPLETDGAISAFNGNADNMFTHRGITKIPFANAITLSGNVNLALKLSIYASSCTSTFEECNTLTLIPETTLTSPVKYIEIVFYGSGTTSYEQMFYNVQNLFNNSKLPELQKILIKFNGSGAGNISGMFTSLSNTGKLSYIQIYGKYNKPSYQRYPMLNLVKSPWAQGVINPLYSLTLDSAGEYQAADFFSDLGAIGQFHITSSEHQFDISTFLRGCYFINSPGVAKLEFYGNMKITPYWLYTLLDRPRINTGAMYTTFERDQILNKLATLELDGQSIPTSPLRDKNYLDGANFDQSSKAWLRANPFKNVTTTL